MGGKKKAAAKKKGGKDGDEEDLSVDNFMKFYRKKCAELQCDVSKIIKEKFEEYLEEGEPITKVLVSHSYRLVPYLGRTGLVRSKSNNGCFETSQVGLAWFNTSIAINT